MLTSIRSKCTMTDGLVSIAEILAFYCFFITLEPVEVLK
jgi:hypothetical protein